AVPSLAYQTPEAGNKHEHPDNATEPKGQESQKAKESLPAVIEQQTSHGEVADQKSQSKASESTQQSHDWIDKLNALSTTVIAFFTILLFFGVIRQIRTARDTDRAWIVVSPLETAPEIGYIAFPNPELYDIGKDHANAFGARLTNTGETPAKM